MVFTGVASGTVAKCILVIATAVFYTGGTLCYATSTIIITDCIVVDSIYINNYNIIMWHLESNDHLNAYIL